MNTIKIFRTTGKTEKYTDKKYVKATVDLIEEINKGSKSILARFLAGDVCTIHLNDKIIYSRREQLDKKLDENVLKMIDKIKCENK